jgi:hypothetical protein
MRSVPLDESASGVFDTVGTAVVQIGPSRRQVWHTSNVAVVTDSALSTAARVYRGSVAPGNYLAGTHSGNGDNAPLEVTLTPGALLTVVWSGGTPGARATVSLYGSMEVN